MEDFFFFFFFFLFSFSNFSFFFFFFFFCFLPFLLGETNKIISLSANRVTPQGVNDATTGFNITLKGEPGENLTLGAWPPQGEGERRVVKRKCEVGETGIILFVCDSEEESCSCKN